jgi:hypothetical protein
MEEENALTRTIHECRREAFETEACRGFSQVRPTEAYMQSVEEADREKPRQARGSDDVVGIHESSGLRFQPAKRSVSWLVNQRPFQLC